MQQSHGFPEAASSWLLEALGCQYQFESLHVHQCIKILSGNITHSPRLLFIEVT